MDDRVLVMVRYMVSPPTQCDLPGELTVAALLALDEPALEEAVTAGYVAVGAEPKPPGWVWAHYAETYVEYRARSEQYAPSPVSVDAPSFVSIASITVRGWEMLKLTRDALPVPRWHRCG